jgi:WXG100 family type VII secretion target
MSAITVTASQLRDKAAELKSQAANLKGQIENLQSQESALSGMWEGEAREAFRNAIKTDVAKMQQFVAAIEQYAQALLNIAQQYEQAENKATGIASARKA